MTTTFESDAETAAEVTEKSNDWEGKTFEIKRRSGNITQVRFTKTRATILGLLLNDTATSDVIAQGFNKSTVTTVYYQARKLGLLNR